MATTTDTRTGHLPGTPAYRRLNVAMVLVGLAAFGILGGLALTVLRRRRA